jgi:hypothetical protein
MTMDNPQTVPPVETSAYANPYTAPTAPPPMPGTQGYPGQVFPSQVSPGLAFGLGLIPGVGAIYNGQYAKGLTHVVIFGLFISILDSGAAQGYEPLVALLMAGFCCYMPFEAYHTALRRQRGEIEDEFSSLLPVHGSSRFPVAPVVLIALGTIFLLHNMNLLDFERWLRYWPVLLIALGAYMLVARMNTSGSSGSGSPAGSSTASSAAERPRDAGGEQ